MNTAFQAESFRSFYLHVASMSSGPSLLKDLAALKWTAGSPLPTTLPKAWLEGRKDTQGHDYMGHSLLKGCVEQHGWFLTPCSTNTTDCFVKEGVAGEEEQWVYAALLMHLEGVGAKEGSHREKLQVGAGCKSHINWDAAVRGKSGRLWKEKEACLQRGATHSQVSEVMARRLSLESRGFWAVRKLQAAARLKASMG